MKKVCYMLDIIIFCIAITFPPWLKTFNWCNFRAKISLDFKLYTI